MNKKKICFYIVTLTIFISLVTGAYGVEFTFNLKHETKYEPDKILTEYQIEEDVRYLFKNIEELHPNIFFLQSRDAVENFKNNIINDVGKGSLTSKDLSIISAKVVSFLGGDHMRLKPFGNDKYAAPFRVKKFNNKYYLVDVLAEQSLIGREVLSINNIPIDKLWQKITLFSRRPYGRIMDTTVSTHFSNLMSIVYSFEKFSLELKESVKHINAIPEIIKMNSGITKWYTRLKTTDACENKEPILYFEDNVPILKLCSFEKVTKSSLLTLRKQLKTSKELVVDLRDNPGGDTVTMALFLNWISGLPSLDTIIPEGGAIIKASSAARISYERDIPWLLRTFALDDTQKIVRDYPFNTKPKFIEIKELSSEKANSKAAMSAHLELDRIILIIDNNTRSAAALLSGVLQKHAKAIVVGERSGGSAERLFMQTLDSELPNSKLRVLVGTGLIDTTNETHFPNRIKYPNSTTNGVLPDIVVTPDIEDFRSGLDKQLQTAISLSSKFVKEESARLND